MRLKRSLSAGAVIFGLVAGLAFLGGPCCGAVASESPDTTIGSAPCCGPGGCEATIQRADDLAAAPSSPSLPSLAVLGHAGTDPIVLPSSRPIATVRPLLRRPDLARLAVPLLI
jgi:hypothetical protein